ncbi:MAG: NAD(+) diphosphatase [Opitutae bacterium]|nr:NAD(+) diphosphatase [Opitutae bacterium]
MSFVHCHAPAAQPAAADWRLVVQGDRLLARPAPTTEIVLPDGAALAEWNANASAELHLGILNDRACWLHAVASAETAAPAGWEWHDTRALIPLLTAAQFQAVSCARMLHVWQNRHRFCGSCGTPTVDVAEERAKKCPRCGALFFPSASPAVIVAVTRGDRLLLAHNRNFRPGLFSLLAGFVDPGETLEQTIVREVREETGIEVGEPRYVTSQPWPFPNSLMLGFRATYRAGEIAVDGKEIEQADWFHRDALPDLPRPGTVARALVDAWCRGG